MNWQLKQEIGINLPFSDKYNLSLCENVYWSVGAVFQFLTFLYMQCVETPTLSSLPRRHWWWVVGDCMYHPRQLSWLDQNRIHKCFTLTVNAQKWQNFSLTDMHTLDTSVSNQNLSRFYRPGLCRKARLSWAFSLSTTNSTCIMPPFSLILLEVFLFSSLSNLGFFFCVTAVTCECKRLYKIQLCHLTLCFLLSSNCPWTWPGGSRSCKSWKSWGSVLQSHRPILDSS